ncbi:MAG: hypothetical protein MPI95_04025 [Nitrosopumilus sp.]|nr:hypothetical protein [Nitrosopumilus sp.]MDA7953406.1 hypothetical protein [Nitrosopumilus sp.]MDA7958244.1 hypothetical protein [Nitrosopumilus sp.]
MIGAACLMALALAAGVHLAHAQSGEAPGWICGEDGLPPGPRPPAGGLPGGHPAPCDVAGATVELDQDVYTWTDRVLITVTDPAANRDGAVREVIGGPDRPVGVYTRHGSIGGYQLVETGPDTGVFAGSITLTGSHHDDLGVYAIGVVSRGPAGTGPSDGVIPAGGGDLITVSYGSPGGGTVTASSPIRWNVGQVEWLAASYPVSTFGYIRVIDPDMNLDPDGIDRFDVGITHTTEHRGINVYETSEDSGIFEGHAVFSTSDPPVGHYLQVRGGETVTAYYSDFTLPKTHSVDPETGITAITCIIPCDPEPPETAGGAASTTDTGSRDVAGPAPPNAQFESGVPIEEIKCRDGMILLESPRGRPVCATEGSAGRLVQRGFEEAAPAVAVRDADVPRASVDVPDVPPGNATGAEPDAAPGGDADTGPADVISRGTSPAGATDTTEKTGGGDPVILFDVESLEDEAERLGLISDERYEYAFKMPLEDPDAFVEKLMAGMDDRVIKKTQTMPGSWYEYDTERGKVTMHATEDIPVARYEVGKIDRDGIKPFIGQVLDAFEIDSDEDEIDYSSYWALSFGVKYNVVSVQQKLENGFKIHRHYVDFSFKPDTTLVGFSSWISDIDKFDLYPFNQAQLVARDYIADYEELQKDDCSYVSSIVRSKVVLLAGRPVYKVDLGTCTVPHKTEVYDLGSGVGPEVRNLYYSFNVYVDAVTGEPMFAHKSEGNGRWHWLHSRGVIP